MREKHPCPLGGCPNKENIPQDPDKFLDHFSVWHTKKQGEIFLAVRQLLEHDNAIACRFPQFEKERHSSV